MAVSSFDIDSVTALLHSARVSGCRVIGIAGGIGSGKSVVSRILNVLGYDVYDCDSRARRLMDASDDIKTQLVAAFSPQIIDRSGAVDRKMLADIVFADKTKLNALNSIVHASVRYDMASCIKHCHDNVFFFESAIIYEAALDLVCDEIWTVSAPLEVRISRVMMRNNLSREQVLARIDSQTASHPDIRPATNSDSLAGANPIIHTIDNDNVTPVLPQILSLL